MAALYNYILILNRSGIAGIFIAIFISVEISYAQCPTVQAIMIDACNPESVNEFVIIQSGGGFNVNNLSIDYDINNNILGPENNDINVNPSPCGLTTGNTAAYTGCSNLIAVGPGFNVPPNSILVVQTSAGSTNGLYNFSSLCGSGQCVYVISSSCTRTAGAFTNVGTGIRTTIFSFGGGCNVTVDYDRSLLTGGDGAYYLPGSNTYGNGGCNVPPSGPATPPVTPTFNPVPALCQGQTPPPLQTTSNNGISGSWSPSSISTASAGTTIYTFTPFAGQCSNTATLSVTVNPTLTPVFSSFGPYCQGETPASLPGISNNGVSGTWSPSAISTASPGTTIYTFTPSTGQCATTQTVSVTVNPTVTPTFTSYGPYCVGESAPPLPGISLNGINGSWSPASISTASAGTTIYTFTPTTGQCATTQTVSVTVNAPAVPAFDNFGPYCQNASAPPLPGTSNNGITGSWNPATINTSVVGTSSYSFTPNPGQCATNQNINITVNPVVTPQFSSFGPYCQNSAAPPLPTTSNNGVQGIWAPAVINTSTPGMTSYTFTPNAGQCADPVTISITINPEITPVFNPIPNLCQNDPSITLPTTSNNGVSGNWAPPTVQTTLPGTQMYSFTPTPGQCATPLSINVTVTATITPVFNPVPDQCQFATPPALPGSSVNGVTGSWNPGVINTSTTGTFSYTFTPSAPACAQQTTLSVTILPNITPALPALGPYCQNDPAVSLPGTVNGISGTWSGPGVSGNQFNPSASGTGNFVLLFDPFPNQCANANTTSVNVIANPTGNLSGSPQLCKGQCGTVNFNFNGGSGTFNINMNINVAGFFNFNFPMIGVTNNTTLTICYQNNPLPFNPATNTLYVPLNTPPGNASLTLLNFTSTPAGNCPSGIVGNPGTISVTLLPEPDANPASITECDFDQDGQAVFNLPGVDNTVKNNVAANTVAWFSNAAATLPIANPANFTASNGTIVYAQVSNPQGCTKIAPVNLIVQAPQVPALSPFTTCENGNTISLPGNVGGINGSWSSPGGNVTANVFNPAGLPAGNYPITFTPNPGICAVSATTNVNIITAGPVPLPATLATECLGSAVYNLPGSVGGVSGQWSGSPFITGGIFDFGLSGAGTFTLTFTPDASAGCLQPNTTAITVVPNTNIAPQTLQEICQTNSPFNLPGTLAGYTGSWLNNVNVFNNVLTVPAFPGAALTLNLTFDPDNVCINNIAAVIQINAPASINPVTFPGLCLSSDPFLLPSSVEGYSGSWTLAGNNIIQINPQVLGEGSFTLVFTPSAGQCANSTTGSIQINAFTAGNDAALQYCNAGTDIVNLNNYLSPGATPGGVWTISGNAVTNPAAFDLNTLPAGQNTFSYQLNDPVCGADDANIVITVAIAPFAGNSGNLSVCQSDLTSVDFSAITGIPDAGGNWVVPMGTNINLSELSDVDLSALSPGNYTFSYIIPDGICPGASANLDVEITAFNSAGPDITFAACAGSMLDITSLINPAYVGGILENITGLSGFDGMNWNTAGNAEGGYLFRYFFDNPSPCIADTAHIAITLSNVLSAGSDVSASFCQSTSINLNNFLGATASPGGQFFFEGNPVPGGIFTPDNQTIYSFEYRVGDGVVCPVSSANIILAQNFRPDFTAALSNTQICVGQTTQLNINFPAVTEDLIVYLSATSVQTGIRFIYQAILPSPVLVNITAASSLPYSFFRLPADQTFIISLDSFTVQSSGCVFPNTAQNLSITTRSIPTSNLVRQLCPGQSVTVGNTTFNQNNPSGTVTIPAGGPGLCDSVVNVSLTFFPAIAPTNINRTTCDNNFSLTVGNVVFNRANPIGSVTLQSINGCDSVVNVSLTFNSFSTGVFNASTCDSTAIYTVGNQQFSVFNPSGTVTLTGASAAGCDSIVTVNISYLPTRSGTFSFTTCDPTYFINIGNTRFDNQNRSGVVRLNGAAANGCDSLVNVQLSYLSPAVRNLNITTCNENFSTTVGNTVFNRQNPAGQVVLPNAAQNGCDSTVSVQITFAAFEFTADFTAPCPGQSASVSINSSNTAGPYQLSVNGGQAQAVNTLPYTLTLMSGNYTLTFINAESCTQTRSISIPNTTEPVSSIRQTLLPNGNIQLNVESTAQNINSVNWTANSRLSCTACDNPVLSNPVNGEILTAVLTYGNGCSQNLEVEIRKSEAPVVVMPNVLSPESGNGNDRFFVQLPENTNGTVLLFRIFDRWGELLFEKTNIPPNIPEEGWDGRYKKTIVVPGVYVYYIELAIEGEDKPRKLYGNITIFR